MRFAALALAAAACGGSPPSPPPAPPAPAGPPCLADRIPDPIPDQERPIVCRGAEGSCRSWCEAGRATACVSLAYLLDGDDSAEAERLALYTRACELGDLNGCTNAGAELLYRSDEDAPCAARLHRAACEGGEAWGCGMWGRELADGLGVPADLERAKRVLAKACEELGSFSCRVLGEMLADGRFGEGHEAAARGAVARACETGDDAACDLL